MSTHWGENSKTPILKVRPNVVAEVATDSGRARQATSGTRPTTETTNLKFPRFQGIADVDDKQLGRAGGPASGCRATVNAGVS
jgi:hypothetical protein